MASRLRACSRPEPRSRATTATRSITWSGPPPPSYRRHGFGYALADGTYANPFYGAHFAKPDYYAFFSDPANRRTSEPSVAFTATIAP